MAHLNSLPPRAAGVNFWFFIAVPFDGGCWYKAKCEMLLRKTDGEMNMQNCEMVTVATCFMTDGNGSYHGLAPLFFEELTRCRRQNHCRRRPGNPNGPSLFRKYRVYLPLLCLFTSTRTRLLFRGWRQRQLPRTHTIVFRRDDTLLTSITSLEMTRQP